MSLFKTAIISVVAIAAIAGGVIIAQQNSQLSKLRQDNLQFAQQTEELSTLKEKTQKLQDQLTKAQSVTPEQLTELLKLRNEVGMLRGSNTALTASLARAAAQAQAQAQKLQKQTDTPPARADVQPPQVDNSQNERDLCLLNLRKIDVAKQMWALENNKIQTAVPTMTDLKPYLDATTGGKRLVCPAGGAYTISSVQSLPRCSISGHVLPIETGGN